MLLYCLPYKANKHYISRRAVSSAVIHWTDWRQQPWCWCVTSGKTHAIWKKQHSGRTAGLNDEFQLDIRVRITQPVFRPAVDEQVTLRYTYGLGCVFIGGSLHAGAERTSNRPMCDGRNNSSSSEQSAGTYPSPGRLLKCYSWASTTSSSDVDPLLILWRQTPYL